MTKKGRVFSGARPTGRQHLGNYLGAIKNYVALQDDYECVYCIVDLHALTTVEDTEDLRQNTYEMALDWLAAGIRPQESIVFVQSHVPEVTELHTILSMVTPLGKLTELPTFKDKIRQQPDNVNYGLVGYPVLMTADIVLYKSNIVPVGIDQAPHLEFAREIVRSFNYRYKTHVLIEPQIKTTEVPKVLGIDGKEKMSKSLNNHIELAATPGRDGETRPGNGDRPGPRAGAPIPATRISAMSSRMHKSSPRRPISTWSTSSAGVPGSDASIARCSLPGISIITSSHFARGALEIASKPAAVQEVLDDGAKRARKIARATMKEVRAAVGLP